MVHLQEILEVHIICILYTDVIFQYEKKKRSAEPNGINPFSAGAYPDDIASK